MQSNEAYRVEGFVTDEGDIHASGLPFEKGQRVELVVWRSASQVGGNLPSREEIARRLAGLDEMVNWFEPNRPKNLADLPDSAFDRETIYQDRGM